MAYAVQLPTQASKVQAEESSAKNVESEQVDFFILNGNTRSLANIDYNYSAKSKNKYHIYYHARLS